ncbi:hypothetical protein Q9L58_001179 [Maublancomyces gigas]|uniref:Uncharacterized protein n=1 Tax=Discina gigas TaxID=1032678 RepID=A0ABR3GUL8_9PEZI
MFVTKKLKRTPPTITQAPNNTTLKAKIGVIDPIPKGLTATTAWVMYFPESPSKSTSTRPSAPSAPWAPPPAPPPEIVSEEEKSTLSLLVLLEDDAAFVENDLHVMRYTLQSLKTAVRAHVSTQRDTLQILGELEIVDRDMSKLVERLEQIGIELGGLSWNVTKRELEKQYVVIDRTLVAAEEMRKELRLWADTIYLGNCDLASSRPMEVAGS